ncbi:UvrD-helicase domain-containing protein [Chloroflexota bacterium]
MSGFFPSLSDEQCQIIRQPLDAKLFLEGPAGAGKTTVGVERLLHLLDSGLPGQSILALVPQRTLVQPYFRAIRQPDLTACGLISILTIGGLARRMIDLFWPLIVEEAGFTSKKERPIFLTLETAQYYMAHLVRPLLDEGLFDAVKIDRNRLYSQIIDNLNKSALVGFPYSEFGSRLQAAWTGELSQVRLYEDAQTCADLFRAYCLEHNLLDFSLQIEIFKNHLWVSPSCRNYLTGRYKYLIVDNLEEDTPNTHDLLRDWMPYLNSFLLIYDQDAGYRSFLGADPESAYGLKELCDEKFIFANSFVNSKDMLALGQNVSTEIMRRRESSDIRSKGGATGILNGNPRGAFVIEDHRYYPQMLDWVVNKIAELVYEEGLPPGEIVILAPFMSDALRFMLTNRMKNYHIPVISHRPSRSLREEPVTQCLLTLSAISHPEWGLPPSNPDVGYALIQAIEGLDLIRAQILTQIVYRINEGTTVLSSFDQIIPQMQERITYRIGARYERLRSWIMDNRNYHIAFDHYLSRLFGEVLSQPGFGFHNNFEAGLVSANLIESVRKFRRVADKSLTDEGQPLGKEYLLMVQDGVIAAQYLRSWQDFRREAVLIAPAYTYLLSNRPVDVQFWLDIGSRGWFERLNQPLTHPYVLSRSWSQDKLWTDKEEVDTSLELLQRLTMGLLRRCRHKIYMTLSELGEQGYEQRGPLLQAVQRMLIDAAQD